MPPKAFSFGEHIFQREGILAIFRNDAEIALPDGRIINRLSIFVKAKQLKNPYIFAILQYVHIPAFLRKKRKAHK